MNSNDNMLALLESLMPEPAEDVARKIADDFRKRRVEKGLTRSDIAKKSGVSLANITRFEQKALISLNNLIELAISLGYNLEIKEIFAIPKYSTMEGLLQIRKNQGKTKTYKGRDGTLPRHTTLLSTPKATTENMPHPSMTQVTPKCQIFSKSTNA